MWHFHFFFIFPQNNILWPRDKKRSENVTSMPPYKTLYNWQCFYFRFFLCKWNASGIYKAVSLPQWHTNIPEKQTDKIAKYSGGKGLWNNLWILKWFTVFPKYLNGTVIMTIYKPSNKMSQMSISKYSWPPKVCAPKKI